MRGEDWLKLRDDTNERAVNIMMGDARGSAIKGSIQRVETVGQTEFKFAVTILTIMAFF